MKRFISVLLLWLLCVPAFAQTCNTPVPWFTSYGPFALGNLPSLGPQCNQFQDSGVAATTLIPARGYLAGNILSGGGSQTLTISPGQATSDDQSSAMVLPFTFTKTFSSWSVGSGTGALDTGSIAVNTWYHVFIIQRSDTKLVDLLFSMSATSPTLPTNYTQKRRIGSIKTDGTPNIISFLQVADYFYRAPNADYNSTASQALALTTLPSVPTGIVVQPLIALNFTSTATATQPTTVQFAPAANSALTTTIAISVGGNNLSAAVGGGPEIIAPATNSSGQIFVGVTPAISTNAGQLNVHGWIDTRGRYN